MTHRRRTLFIAAAVILLALTSIALLSWKVKRVVGTVYEQNGQAMAGASVRLRASELGAQTDAEGHFILTGFNPAFKVRVTAWADGYYIAGSTVWPWERDISLTLSPYTVPDNTDYVWIPPAVEQRSPWEMIRIRARLDPAAALAPDVLFFKAADGLALGCRDCHGEVIYDQWISSAHALGFANPRFASTYNGTDITGQHQSPPTRYSYSRDYGRFPLRPDPTQAYYGPGYKLDFPDTTGNCAACHLPAAALAQPYGTDPNTVVGVDALGAHCDFCHKIADVKLNPDTGLPYDNMPGVLSLLMMRPSLEKQLFFGPYDDVDAGTDSYLPLQRQSQYCAPCHTASFWGVPIYESFAEWLASPYSDPATGQTCQDCHMKPDGVTTNFAPNRAGQERDPTEIFTHAFPGAADETLLQNAVTMAVEARRNGDQIIVNVTLVNDQTGHHIPTDSPLRQMILLVRATDAQGRVLTLLEGPTVPEWGGVGDPEDGYYAGLPGKIFAKFLMELWTEIAPTGAYWNPTRIVSDNRLAVFETATSSYVFAMPAGGKATVRVSLLFRRAFKELAVQKGWEVDDILMAEERMRVP
jgi:hypothetical protein